MVHFKNPINESADEMVEGKRASPTLHDSFLPKRPTNDIFDITSFLSSPSSSSTSSSTNIESRQHVCRQGAHENDNKDVKTFNGFVLGMMEVEDFMKKDMK
ncbi:hypothetical protein ACFE04_026401 [Oxalis oulophora]